MEKKFTKREVFEAVIDFVKDAEDICDIPAEVVTEVMTKAVEQDIKRADKAKERAAAKKSESDELTAKISGMLSEEPMSGMEIAEALGEGVTKQKVVSRMSKLIADGVAVKEQKKTETGKITVYKLA